MEDQMVQVTYVIGISMAIVNLLKNRFNLPKDLIPVLAVVLAVGFNLLNAFVFGGDYVSAGKAAFIESGILVGLFATTDKKGGVANGNRI